jgi:hypothetical protein
MQIYLYIQGGIKMFNFTFKKTQEVQPQKKPKYGAAVAITAGAVVAIETAVVATFAILKKRADKKLAAQNFDDTFDSDVENHECEVTYEEIPESESEKEDADAE